MSKMAVINHPAMEVIRFRSPLTSALEREVREMLSVWTELAQLTRKMQDFVAK